MTIVLAFWAIYFTGFVAGILFGVIKQDIRRNRWYWGSVLLWPSYLVLGLALALDAYAHDKWRAHKYKKMVERKQDVDYPN